MKKIKLENIYKEKIKLQIVDSQEKAEFITHSGTFHADEVMATIFLLNKFGNIKLCRTPKVTNENAFVYDIGFKEFDHHGLEFDSKRENGIKYASCGLVWQKFGREIIEKLGIENVDAFYDIIEKNIVMDIDRDDNGQKLNNEPEIKPYSIPNIIS